MGHLILSFLIARIKTLKFAKYNFFDFTIDYKDFESFTTLDISYKKKLISKLIFGYNFCFNCLVIFEEHEFLKHIKAGLKQAGIDAPYVFNNEMNKT